jgi:uncharacterized membrane protein YoaK (UPF0700 family)
MSGPYGFFVGILLTAVAGYVDAVGFIELGGFFASFMSGASISVGVAFSGNDWAAVYHAGLLISAFLFAATISECASGAGRTWALPIVLSLGAMCLFAAVGMTYTGLSSQLAIVPVVAAMGIQNTALRPIEGVRLGVTFMTGTLVSLAQSVGQALSRRSGSWDWLPHAIVWCSFVCGACIGAIAYRLYGFGALKVPAIIVGLMGACIGAISFFGGRSKYRRRSARKRPLRVLRSRRSE